MPFIVESLGEGIQVATVLLCRAFRGWAFAIVTAGKRSLRLTGITRRGYSMAGWERVYFIA
ncbi:hypothetical protein [Rheinheimera hassiensis]|uniref:hypothetical protein n=1 Tax=Rheinheimera hassiensis TaxID=1193627 RepID=UPI001F062913|nr:hypothetical protein [Rheinheimera hassiensis]